jgi:hypothetical protein
MRHFELLWLLFPSGPQSFGSDLLTGFVGLIVGTGVLAKALRGIWSRGTLGPKGEYASNWCLTAVSLAGGSVAVVFGISRLVRSFTAY